MSISLHCCCFCSASFNPYLSDSSSDGSGGEEEEEDGLQPLGVSPLPNDIVSGDDMVDLFDLAESK